MTEITNSLGCATHNPQLGQRRECVQAYFLQTRTSAHTSHTAMTPRACAALTLFVATVAHTQRATALSLHIPARAVAVGGERAAAPAAAAAVCGKRQSSSSSTELRCAGGEGSSSNRSNTRRSVWARGPGWAPSSRRSGAPKRPPSLRDGPESGTAAGGAGGGTRCVSVFLKRLT